MKSIRVQYTKTFDLSPVQVTEVVMQYLDQVCEGRWIQDRSIMEEQATSHRFDAVIGDVDDQHFALFVAAYRLRQEMRIRAEGPR